MVWLSRIGAAPFWIFCTLCTHARRWRPAELRELLGYDADINDIVRRSKCDNCGTHRAELRTMEPKSDEKRLRRYRKGWVARPRPPDKEIPYSSLIPKKEVAAEPEPRFLPGSCEALTLAEAEEQVAYCYTCKQCQFDERVNLREAAARHKPETLLGDLKTLWPCARCGDMGKIIMVLWLKATTTSRMLRESGYPVWDSDMRNFKAWAERQVSLTTADGGLSVRKRKNSE